MKIWLLKVIGGATLLLIVTLFIGLSYQTTLVIAIILGLIIIGALFALYQSSVASSKTTSVVVTEEMIQEEKLVEAAARTEAPRRVITRSSYTKTIVDASRSIVAGISSLRKYAKIPTIKRPEFLDQLTHQREETSFAPRYEEEVLGEPQDVVYIEPVQPRAPRPSLRDLIERGPAALQEEATEEEIVSVSDNPDEIVDEVFREITQAIIEEPAPQTAQEDEPIIDSEPEEVSEYNNAFIADPQEQVSVPQASEERVIFGRITAKKAPVKKVTPIEEVEEDEQYPDLSENEIEAFVIKPPRRRTKRSALSQEDEVVPPQPHIQEETMPAYEILDSEEIEPTPVVPQEPQRVFSPEPAQQVPLSEPAPLKTPTGILKRRIIRKTLPEHGEDTAPRVGYTKRYEVLD
ncbi:MAG TPA: hypothetical protein VGE63_01705 [Candidatus Paceibacterota bacterium]